MMKNVTNEQLEEMAEAALSSFEGSCEWSNAAEAARDYAIEEFAIRPSPSACCAAVNIAKSKWEAVKISVKTEIG